MKDNCEQGYCAADKSYAVFAGDKIIRITFSRSLADLIAERLGPGHSVRRITFNIGKRLEPNETSSNGLYAIMSSKRDFTLRITLFKEAAQLFCDWDSRYIAECYILTKD